MTYKNKAKKRKNPLNYIFLRKKMGDKPLSGLFLWQLNIFFSVNARKKYNCYNENPKVYTSGYEWWETFERKLQVMPFTNESLPDHHL